MVPSETSAPLHACGVHYLEVVNRVKVDDLLVATIILRPELTTRGDRPLAPLGTTLHPGGSIAETVFPRPALGISVPFANP